MDVTTSLRKLLLPELEAEFASTRKVLANIPDGHTVFKTHEKSMPLSKLAGHTALMAGFIQLILTSPRLDLATMNMEPLVLSTTAQLLAEYDHMADATVTALKEISDQALEQSWEVVAGPRTIFSGTRYMAYRIMGLNHMIHHRGQLSVNLRLVGGVVPSIYGPSADEPLG